MQSNESKTRRRLLTLIIVILGVPLVIAAVLGIYLWRTSPLSREWVIQTLEKRYQCQVELKSFDVSFFPIVSITGEGLVLNRLGPSGPTLLASIRKFSATALWIGLMREPRHFGRVRLEGFVLVIPPRSKPAETKEQQQRQQQDAQQQAFSTTFVLDEILASDALLEIVSSNPRKQPHEFKIHKLRMQSVGVGLPMSFQITLTNPVPVGQIQSQGQFGPWNSTDPSLTPVSGSYKFLDADLSTIRGLGGKLDSLGKYDGVLSEIKVQGETDTPDFDLGISGNRLPLKTQFSAVVDGISGDVLLERVDAQLLGSKIVARGRVARVPEGKGRFVLLDVTAGPARLEDLLRLAVKSSKPSLTGVLSVQTKFDLHPGDETIAKRLKLDGSFDVQSAKFTDSETEAKITGLSRRSQGKPGDEEIQNTPFELQGSFLLANSEAKFSRLTFSLPGALLRLQGAFELTNQKLDFQGDLRLHAKVSQTTRGIKSLLLKPIDRLFERNGAGTVIPLKITGTRAQPSIQVDFGKVLRREN
jgi:hypothetical protein